MALAAVLHPDQAAVARSLLLAGMADLEDREGSGDADAVAAGNLAAVLSPGHPRLPLIDAASGI
jgi:hypothetical protein